MYNQFDIMWVNLDPTRDSETKKKRPCVIIQSSLFNKKSQTFIVAPLLPNHKNWPFAVNITPSKTNGIDKKRHINLKQLRAVDITRIDNKQGKIEEKHWKKIKESLKLILDI